MNKEEMREAVIREKWAQVTARRTGSEVYREPESGRLVCFHKTYQMISRVLPTLGVHEIVAECAHCGKTDTRERIVDEYTMYEPDVMDGRFTVYAKVNK